ncbi:DUF92 domain-containing protein [Athalassotoga saccharophila]|uniref:DUF92 domain-containing protein n=1 Tax=Athalassotoga saccharophila TaxID=1441386 RepID=UPI00137A5654|nr:DUF92 domain-containing protein [Athalassotoga saccharophila]BBJ28643.1 phytol kinase [Athalassotoga saccharophila]
MNQYWGLLISYAFVFSFIILSSILNKFFHLSDYITRKIVHIGVSNWWFIAISTMKDPFIASIGPISFIIINYISYRHDIFKGMEIEEKSNVGTVYFPISLLVLVLLSYYRLIPFYAAGIGILTMGYGDGLAGLIGKSFGKTKVKIFDNKSLEGSAVMFGATFLVSFLFLQNFGIERAILFSFEIAALSTIIEIITPFGIDNLTVPILTALLAFLFVNSDIFPFLAIIVNFFAALFSYRKNAVDKTGFLAGFAVGSIILMINWLSYLLLMVFFVSASIVSRIGHSKKAESQKINEKGGQRDYLQVLANGGVGMVATILYFLTKNDLFLIATAISFAESNSDTWGSEIGILSRREPISIINFKTLKPGLSGGVSTIGFLASLIGAFIISGVFAIFEGNSQKGWELFILIGIAGFVGSIIDSIIGALFEVKYVTEDGLIVERRFWNGKENKIYYGFSFINNDFVNFASCAITTLIFTFIYSLVI